MLVKNVQLKRWNQFMVGGFKTVSLAWMKNKLWLVIRVFFSTRAWGIRKECMSQQGSFSTVVTTMEGKYELEVLYWSSILSYNVQNILTNSFFTIFFSAQTYQTAQEFSMNYYILCNGPMFFLTGSIFHLITQSFMEEITLLWRP